MSILRATCAVYLMCSVGAAIAGPDYCAVEVGSKGVKGAAYTFLIVGEGLEVQQHFSRSENTTIVGSAKDGVFTESAITETAEAANRLMAEAERSAPGCRKFIVMSSGVLERGSRSLSALAQRLSQKTGVQESSIEGITADAEADFALRSSVPKKSLLPESVMFDIGSGNTKIGYVNSSDGRFNSISLPWGSTTFTKDALADMNDFRIGLAKLMVSKVAPEFVQQVQKAPAVVNRKRIYWVGGAAWATSLWTHPESISSPVVEISSLDIENFIFALQQKTWTERQAPKGMSDADRKKWQKEFARSQEVFTPENLQSGVGLMRTMLQHSNPKVRVLFPRNGQWLYGYTLAKFNEGS